MKASIVKYVGKSQYNFTVPEDMVNKEVHWYLMTADNYHSKPQREEFFLDSGYYKFHEIYHLLRFANEKQISREGIPGISGTAQCRFMGQAAEVFLIYVKKIRAAYLHYASHYAAFVVSKYFLNRCLKIKEETDKIIMDKGVLCAKNAEVEKRLFCRGRHPRCREGKGSY